MFRANSRLWILVPNVKVDLLPPPVFARMSERTHSHVRVLLRGATCIEVAPISHEGDAECDPVDRKHMREI